MDYFKYLVFAIAVFLVTIAQTKSSDVEVLIIGAGAAGLHSAVKLAQKGITNVAILEAQERIGGRIKSVATNGNWIEHGAQWIHGQAQSPLWKFIQENNIPTAAEASRAGAGAVIRDDGKEIPENILTESLAAFGVFRDSCDKAATAVPPISVGDYLTSEFNKWMKTKSDTVETQNWRKQVFKYWLKVEQFDAACFNQFNQSTISWCNYETIEPDTSFSNGYQSLLDTYEQIIDNSNIPLHLNTKVTKIRWQNDNGKVIVETEEGDVYNADYVISTVSLGYLKRYHSGLFVPSLPQQIAKVIDTLKMGSANKIFLEFEKPFWEKKDPGYQFLYAGDATDEKVSDTNWVRWILGFDVVQNQPNMLVGWISGQPAKFIEGLSDETIAEGVKTLLETTVRKLNQDTSFNLPKLVKITVTRWNSNPYSLGSYSYRETDSDTLHISHNDLANPVLYEDVPKVLFAGEATTDEYYTAVHGAIASAEREVERIIESKQQK